MPLKDKFGLVVSLVALSFFSLPPPHSFPPVRPLPPLRNPLHLPAKINPQAVNIGGGGWSFVTCSACTAHTSKRRRRRR